MRSFSILLLLLLSLAVPTLGKDSMKLSDYQWKNRVIVAYPEDEDGWKAIQDSIKREQHKIAERDLIIVDQSVLNEQDRVMLEKEGLVKGSYLLIGKDGGVKGKQTGKLDFSKWFALIDTMPMRKREMTEK